MPSWARTRRTTGGWATRGGGFTALNQVDGEQAFYSQSISQAQPGPFPDAFSSTFNVNGTGSFVLPENLGLDTGASESVSLWFKTTATGQVLAGASADQIGAGTTSTTTSGFVPVLYVGADGRLQGQFYTGSAANTISTSTAVNDGHRHNAVLTAGADPAGGGGSQQEDLYLDGQLVAHTLAGQGATGVQANNTYFGAGFLGGSWPDIPAADQTAGKGTTAFYTGSMSDVAYYLSQLSAAQVAQEWNAAQGAAGPGPSETATVTDPGGKTVAYQMDPLNGDRLTAQTDGLGNTTKYGYDTDGFQDSVIDPNGNVTFTGHDIRGNVTSQTTCQSQTESQELAGLCSTAYFSYYPDDTSAILTPDARNDLPLTERAPRSQGWPGAALSGMRLCRCMTWQHPRFGMRSQQSR